MTFREPSGGADWEDLEGFSALTDSERHLAHIVRGAGKWFVFDGTHRNASGRGFELLGACDALEDAKQLAERILTEGVPHPAGMDFAPRPRSLRIRQWTLRGREWHDALNRAAIAIEWATVSDDCRLARKRMRVLADLIAAAQIAMGDRVDLTPLTREANRMGLAVLARRRKDLSLAIADFREVLRSLGADEKVIK